MRAILELEGPGWGGGNATSVSLGVHPFVRHFKRGEIVHVDCPKGSEEEREWQTLIDHDMCRILPGPGTPLKPAA